MEVNNPFLSRTMIKNPDDFFGRQIELRTIFTRISNLQSCNIYGERKIGQSSLLYYVFLRINRILGNDYIVAYIDAHNPKYHKIEGFLKYSLKELGYNQNIILSSNNINENLIAFSESIQELRESNKPVLLIDEFDSLFMGREFNDDFFDTLRSLSINGDIAYVINSSSSLKTHYKRACFTSPFYNVFSEIHLGKFTFEETTEFLSKKIGGTEFTEEEKEFIKKMANDHPYRLQIACYHVFGNKGKKWNEKKLRKDIRKEFDDIWAIRTHFIMKQFKGLYTFTKEIIKNTRINLR